MQYKESLKKESLYKIKDDQLWTKINNSWYLVACSTFGGKNGKTSTLATTLDFLSLGLTPVDKGDMGLKIQLSGRLKGVRMARKVEEHVGVGLRSQSIEWAIEEENRQIYTKWGTIGLKVSRGGAKER